MSSFRPAARIWHASGSTPAIPVPLARGAQNAKISAAQAMSRSDRRPVHIGGYMRGWQRLVGHTV
jgi:hypothetical protein